MTNLVNWSLQTFVQFDKLALTDFSKRNKIDQDIKKLKIFGRERTIKKFNLVKTLQAKRALPITLFGILLIAIIAVPISASITASNSVFSSNFETGNFSQWNGGTYGTISVTSAVVHSGSYSAKAMTSGSNSAGVVLNWFSTTYSSLYAWSYIYVTALPSPGQYLLVGNGIESQGGYDISTPYIYNNGGQMQWALGYCSSNGQSYFSYSSAAINANQWYFVVAYVNSASNGEVRLYVDNSIIIDVSNVRNSNWLAAGLQAGAYTPSGSSLTTSVYLSECGAGTSLPTASTTTSPTPTPTATPTQAPTSSPAPSPSPTASPTPTPKPTQAPMSTPTPTAKPTPTPSPTPTPAPTSAPLNNPSNIATIPNFWSISTSGMDWSIGSKNAVGMDTYPVTQGGQTAIQMQPNSYYKSTGVGGPGTCELDGNFVSVKPGAHITFKAWIYTGASSIGDKGPLYGGSMGIDMYGSNGRICEIHTTNGAVTYPNYPTPDTVGPNSNGWVHVTMDFTVPSQYEADPWGSYRAGTMVSPIGFIPWFTWDSSKPSAETAHMWIYGTELYIA